MNGPIDAEDLLISRAAEDPDVRKRLIEKPRDTIEEELGVTLAEDHEIHVHEDTATATHLVVPPPDRFSPAERKAARAGAASLDFLRKTLYDPAPPARPPTSGPRGMQRSRDTSEALAEAARDSIRRGLVFLESDMDENGAWRCVRFNLARPDIPRHFEKPPFVSALCVLALESCGKAQAKTICDATRNYLVDTIEFPGFWRYYRHLPQDLDSTALCSLVIGSHPWIFLGRNVPRMLSNRDEEGRFLTWILEDDEPDVASRFRIEADPVVNANVIAHLGDHRETRDAQRWLEALICDGNVEGTSKWYPDTVTTYYAASRAMVRGRPALHNLRPTLGGRILDLFGEKGEAGDILQTAQAVSALYNVRMLERIDTGQQTERFLDSQREDGSWPEQLAFGDQTLRWGVLGQIGHGSEAITTAFCIEAMSRIVEVLGQ